MSIERAILKKYGGGCHQKIGVAAFELPYGRVVSIQGETDQGEVLQDWSLTQISGHSTDEQTRIAVEKIWPRPNESKSLFSREELDSSLPSEGNWLVARTFAALPNWKPSETSVVWTAGLETWTALAARGIWVHGSFDGLGESEDPRLQELLSLQPEQNSWIKLTHADSQTVPEWMNSNGNKGTLLKTYRLLPNKTLPDLSTRSHFYWMSASAFTHAMSAYPYLETKSHASGPGRTAQVIAATLKKPGQIFLSYNQWLKATTGLEASSEVKVPARDELEVEQRGQ